MSKIKKGNTSRCIYSREAYSKDINKGMSAYIDAIKMLNHNTKLLRLVDTRLRASTHLEDSVRDDNLAAIEAMSEHTHTSIDALEELNETIVSKRPTYLRVNNRKVEEWNFNIMSNITNITEWLVELTPVYQSIIDDLDANDVQETPETE